MQKTTYNSGDISNTPSLLENTVINNDFKEKTVCFDWFTCTIDYLKYGDSIKASHDNKFLIECEEEINEIIEILGGKLYINQYDQEYGRFGYKWRIDVQEGIEIHFKGPVSKNNNYTTMINISGHGCKYFTNNNLWSKIFSFFLEKNATFTRLDLAIDDFTGYEITIYEVLELQKNRDYTSIWVKSPLILGTINKDKINGWDGLTIYFGKNSDTGLTLYDKGQEQIDGGGINQFKYWVRWEMRFGKTKSIDIIKQYLVFLDKKIAFFNYATSVLFNLIQFRVRNENNYTKTDWPIHPGYLKFIDKVKLVEYEETKDVLTTLDRKIDWLNRSVFKSLAQCYIVFGPVIFDEWFNRNLLMAMHQIETSDINVMNSKNRELGVEDLTQGDINKFIKDFSQVVRSNYGSDNTCQAMKLSDFQSMKIREIKND